MKYNHYIIDRRALLQLLTYITVANTLHRTLPRAIAVTPLS
jgi:hypothetical protein